MFNSWRRLVLELYRCLSLVNLVSFKRKDVLRVPKRKPGRVPIDIDQLLLEWLMHERSQGQAVTNMDVKTEALEIANKNGHTNLKPSND